jgi:hypothetical protein
LHTTADGEYLKEMNPKISKISWFFSNKTSYVITAPHVNSEQFAQ